MKNSINFVFAIYDKIKLYNISYIDNAYIILDAYVIKSCLELSIKFIFQIIILT